MALGVTRVPPPRPGTGSDPQSRPACYVGDGQWWGRGLGAMTLPGRGGASPSRTARLQSLNCGFAIGFARTRKEAEPGIRTRK